MYIPKMMVNMSGTYSRKESIVASKDLSDCTCPSMQQLITFVEIK